MTTARPFWYINGIPLFRLSPDPIAEDWQNESIDEVVHYKGSNGGAYHANGFAPATFEAEVKVRESDHNALKALRQTSVLFVRVSDDEQRTVVLREYQGRFVRGDNGCWYQGVVRLVDV